MKQGDVLSPLLFNAGLEYAMKKWKLRVQHCGLHCADDELLTNVHYADDLMLYARSGTDLSSMVESSVEELAAVGLHLNTSKTKILTTQNSKEPMFLDIGRDMIEVLHEGQKMSFTTDLLRQKGARKKKQKHKYCRVTFGKGQR